MHRNSVFCLVLIAQIVLCFALLGLFEQEIAFLAASALAYAAGWCLPKFDRSKIVLFGAIQLIAIVLTVLLGKTIGAQPTDQLDFEDAFPLLLSSQFMLIMGWLHSKGKAIRLHWGWILLLGILLALQSNAMLAIGSYRGKLLLNVINLAAAAMALRPHIRFWWHGLVFLLPWVFLETLGGLIPESLITFWNYPLGFSAALATWIMVMFTRKFRQRWLLTGIAVTLSSIFAFGFFNQLLHRNSYLEVTEAYQVPYSELEAVNASAEPPASLHDKLVYIDLWSINCGYCRYMFPEMEVLHKEYAGHPKVRIISVATGKFDKRDKIDAFVAKQGLDFPVYYDSRSLILDHFEEDGVPISFIATPEGKILDYHPGYFPDQGKWYWEKVRERLEEFAG